MKRQYKENRKIAIAHDFLVEYGGAEFVVWQLLKMFPNADIYTPLYKSTKSPRLFWQELTNHNIYTSRLNKIPFITHFYKFFIFFLPKFFENLKLDDYDLIISSSTNFAKFIDPKYAKKHIAYINTPPRFLYNLDTSLFHKIPNVVKIFLKPLLNSLRKKDQYYAKSLKIIVANSKNIQEKIQTIYGKKSTVIYPPVDIENILKYPASSTKDYYLTIGRLYPYKKIDVIIKAFNKLGKKLIIIGKGPEYKKYRKMAKSNIEFKGFVEEQTKIKLLKECKAFVFACEEDFGIVMIEAMAAGKPVIAYNKGGARELIQNKKTGILFSEQSGDAIIQAIKLFERTEFDPDVIINKSKKFTKDAFEKNFNKIINDNGLRRILQ